MTVKREFIDTKLPQGQDEIVAYYFDTTPWGAAAPTGVTAKIFDLTPPGLYDDTSDVNLSGSASVAGNVITTPLVRALVAGHQYRLEVAFTVSGNLFEPFAVINAEM